MVKDPDLSAEDHLHGNPQPKTICMSRGHGSPQPKTICMSKGHGNPQPKTTMQMHRQMKSLSLQHWPGPAQCV